ncbi:hypothetical protein [Zhihengliuella halotolerans]|uniref:hypothetical protein n=1 Tax=Zhihengliuella halotolerans TaxID=370736 RepID=UPI000C7F844F|nr:hypothetical protein [Zhihengliuella halotolerans]
MSHLTTLHARTQPAPPPPCRHQLTRHRAAEPGEYCEAEPIPGSEYCATHAPDHGDNAELAAWLDQTA